MYSYSLIQKNFPYQIRIKTTVNSWLDECTGFANFQLVLVQQKVLCTIQTFLRRFSLLCSEQQYNIIQQCNTTKRNLYSSGLYQWNISYVRRTERRNQNKKVTVRADRKFRYRILTRRTSTFGIDCVIHKRQDR